MAFNPLKEKGTPIERQFRNWDELNVAPYDRDEVHPYTRTRIILMNGIEVEAAMFKHQFARNTDDYVLGQRLAQTRRIEQQQQRIVNWLIPADESTLEVTLGYEQVAVDLTAWLARNEPNPTVRDALDFALIEDFDHLYRYSNLMGLVDGNMYKPVSALPESARYFAYQRVANVDGSAPGQRVIKQHIDRHGRDYRLETEGPHPVERFRAREMARA